MKFQKVKKFIISHKEKFIFFLISLSVFAPLLKSGFILTLDMIFTPNMAYSVPPVSGVYTQIPLNFILNLLAKIIPADVLQKFILIGLFYMIPAIFYKFLSLFDRKEKNKDLVKIAASILYVWNPFVYSRLLAGHWTFLFGYALLPLVSYYLVKLFLFKKLDKNFYTQILLFNLFSIISIIFSVHHFFFISLFVFVFSLISIFKRFPKAFKKSVLLLATFFSLNLIWIIPTITHGIAKSFNSEDLKLFATSPDSQIGVTGNLLAFYGFWAEKTLFTLPKELIPLWPLTAFLLYIPAVLSFLVMTFYKKKLKSIVKNPFFIIFSLIGIFGFILSLGSFGIGKAIFDLFYNKYHLLTAFREPQKFLSLFIFAFSTFFFFGLRFWSEEMEREKLSQIKGLTKKDMQKILNFLSSFIVISYIGLVFVLTYQLVWGANGQLKTTHYPSSWAYLENSASKDDKILVLPFQSYALFSFNERRIANPAPHYFSSQVISREDLEELKSSNQECDIYESFCLKRTDDKEKWIETMEQSSVDYILINKNDDWRNYKATLSEPEFQVVNQDEFAYILKFIR